MTATATNRLPVFEGSSVDRASVKISGSGTGLSEGLRVRPIAYDIGEEGFFVVRVRCAGVEHKEDKDELIVREHKFHIEEMAPISDTIAGKALQDYAREVEKAKSELDGQADLFEEEAALDREARDATDSPAEIAKAAADRAKQ